MGSPFPSNRRLFMSAFSRPTVEIGHVCGTSHFRTVVRRQATFRTVASLVDLRVFFFANISSGKEKGKKKQTEVASSRHCRRQAHRDVLFCSASREDCFCLFHPTPLALVREKRKKKRKKKS